MGRMMTINNPAAKAMRWAYSSRSGFTRRCQRRLYGHTKEEAEVKTRQYSADHDAHPPAPCGLSHRLEQQAQAER